MISSAGRAPPLQGGGRRFDPVITHHFGSLAQLVEQLTFNQLVAGSNPARPTNVKKRPKGAFLLCAKFNNSNLRQVRVEQSETTEPLAATARRASKASYPARPTNVKRRPKGAFLLCAKFNNSNLRQVRVEQSKLSCIPPHIFFTPVLLFLHTAPAPPEARFIADTADRQFCPRSAYFPLHARLPITPARR